MRTPRIKARADAAVYHCINRVVGGEWLLEKDEKEVFRKMMWRQLDFCGLEMITYCIMSQHFHIVVRVPVEEEPLSDEELIRRFGVLYGQEDRRYRVLEELKGRQGMIPWDMRERIEAR
ncbi:MAG: hypothetical protein K9N52_11350, partial [Verrucomicrobia bacterium]|nr:hypothetical protein [Verrucomicrobiota bacterium]